MSQLEQLTNYIKESYHDFPEFLWEDFDSSIWRNERNRKWYAIVQHPTARQLNLKNLNPDDHICILNVRLTPELVAETIDHENYLPAYHMNKKYWLTIRLDGTVNFETICSLLDQSYQIIDTKK